MMFNYIKIKVQIGGHSLESMILMSDLLKKTLIITIWDV